MSKSFKESLKSGIFQFLMLIAGVWLALMANDWSESRKRKKDIDLLLEKIENEIEYNAERLDYIHNYYQTLNDSLEVSRGRLFRKEKVEFYNFWFGRAQPNFLSYAFTLALSTGKMNDLDLNLSMELMKLNAIEKRFSDLITVTYDLNGLGDQSTEEKVKRVGYLTHDVLLSFTTVKKQQELCLDLLN